MWDFSIKNYESVWAVLLQVFGIIAFILIGNILRRVVPFLKKSFIPSSLIGGLILLLINIFCKRVLNFPIIDIDLMKIITYHALAIGFIAMTLRTNKNVQKKKLAIKGVQNGLITGGVYMLQAAFGILAVLIFFFAGKLVEGQSIFYDSGVILPLSFGQGPGNALTWGSNFSNPDHMADISSDGLMTGGGDFGLALATIGFIVASVVGVAYINFYRIRGKITRQEEDNLDEEIEFVSDEEVSKRSANLGIQLGLIGIAYVATFGIMCALSFSDFTSSIAWGFNFIFGVLTANLVKLIVNFFHKKNVIKNEIINNRQMSKVSDFAFDLMIIAGVAAIDIENIADYIWVIVVLCIVGTIVTFIYVKLMARFLFKDLEHDMFLVNFGTLTGTASNGMILLRESDPHFQRESASIFIVSQLPAMLAVAPLLFLLNFSAKSVTSCLIAMGIFFLLAILYTTANIIIHKKTKGKEVEETQEIKE